MIKIIPTLSKRERQILTILEEHPNGISVQEIADLMGVTTNTVKILISRLARKIQALMLPFEVYRIGRGDARYTARRIGQEPPVGV